MKQKLKRSPLFYVGDKFKLMEEIKQYFPKDIKRFIEPFTGGGTVFLNIDAEEYLLNDIDTNLINIHKFLLQQSLNSVQFFKGVKEVIKKYRLSRSYLEDIVPKKLKNKWGKTYYAKHNKIAYYNLKKYYNESDPKDPLILYLLLVYGFNRMLRFNANGKFNLPVGNVDFNKNVENALNNYFEYAKNKNILWSNLDFAKFINKIKFKKNDFIYLDPPYLISFSEYNKLWNIEKEKELLELLDKLNCKEVKFAISNVVFHKNKKNEIFSNWMKKYKVYKIQSNYISYHNNSKKEIFEVLVTNYDKEKI